VGNDKEGSWGWRDGMWGGGELHMFYQLPVVDIHA